MSRTRITGGHYKRFGVGIILSVLLLLMAVTVWATPTVTEMQPPDGSMQPVSTTASATFSEAMDPATITTGSVTVSRFVGVKAIAAGKNHTVALKGDGTVAAWGRNQYGWGGANYYGEGSVPTGLSGVTAIAAGDTHTVALKDDGTVVAWGNLYPAAVPGGLSRVIAIAAGTYHSVALKDDGTVVAWGGDENNFGNKSMVPATLTGVKAIAARGLQTLALKDDGTVVTWGSGTQTWVSTGLSGVVAIAAGRNHVVALKGNGTVVGNSGAPTGLSGVIAIAAGEQHSLALKNDGTVVAWGSNTYGQSTIPASLSGAVVIAVAGGGDYSVALKSDGTMVTWGSNAYGQGTIPTNLSGVTAIAAGGDWAGGFTVALKADGTMAAWGSNYYGETAVPANLSGVIAIGAGRYHTVALKDDGTVVTLGRGPSMADLSGVKAISAGMFHTVALKNDGTVVARGDTVPAGLSGVKAISAGGATHTLALKNDGTVVAWGWNGSGQTNVPAGLSGVVAIAAGGNHSVALKGDGTVVAWGYNYAGQTNVPAGLSGVVAITAGYWGTTALKNDGTVVAWGGNSNGVPADLSGVIAIAAGTHTVALKGDGTVVAWGNNNFGQLRTPTSPYVAPVAGIVDYDQSTDTATFTPSTLLQPNATYLATVNTGARNVWGERLATDVNWQFTTDKALATVTLGNLNQAYDGTPKTVSATTDPPDLDLVITYNGSTTPPTAVGDYLVVATVSDAIFKGEGTGTLKITQPTYTVGVSVLGNNGDISCESPVTKGENSLCTITPAPDYHLETFVDNNVDQLGAVTGNNTYTINNVTADHAITGTFAINLRANAGPDQTIACAGPSGAQIVLDGFASIGAATYTWSGPFGTVKGVSPTITIPWGTHTATLTVTDSTGKTDSDTVVITVFDSLPPQITAVYDGATGDNGWFVSNVGISQTAYDACSGVREIHYTIDGVETIVAGESASVPINGDGVRAIAFWAVDNAGNPGIPTETPIRIDSIAPAITGAALTQPNANDWYNADIAVHFSATDTLSGVASVTPDTTVSAEGAGQSVIGTAVDVAGNRADYNIGGINLDRTAPLITITGVANGMTYNLGLVPQAGFTASDALSGLAGSTGVITGTPDAYGCGTFTYTVTATDSAGNTAISSVTYEVKATPQGTSVLIDTLVNTGLIPAPTAATLLDSLTRALSTYSNDSNLGDNMINAFQNQITAALQSGKIDAETAALLNTAANYIVTNN